MHFGGRWSGIDGVGFDTASFCNAGENQMTVVCTINLMGTDLLIMLNILKLVKPLFVHLVLNDR